MGDVLALIERYRRADSREAYRQAASELLGTIYPEIHAFVSRRIPEKEAGDVCHETVISIARELPKWKGDGLKSFWRFCYTIARRRIADHYRSRSMRLVTLAPEELQRALDAADQADPLSPSVKVDLEATLDLLRKVKPPCYDFLVLHYIQDLDYEEIAKITEMSYDAVRMKIRRCLALARRLAEEGD